MGFCATAPEKLSTGERAALLSVALLAALGAWWALWAVHGGAGGGDAHLHALAQPLKAAPATPASLGALALMWTLMMAGMMLPPVLPWLLFFAAASRETPASPIRAGRTAVFASGYLAVWTGFGVLAAFAEASLASGGLLGGADGRLGMKTAAGAVLLLAGIYQFTPFKGACLRHCRSPLTYFLSSWRDGPAGAFSMGARHGFYCMGCCWALMLVAFAVGVMNFLWMGALTLMLCIEKIAPGGDRVGRFFGGALIFWGAFVIFVGLR